MGKTLTRRDFLKLTGLFSGHFALSSILRTRDPEILPQPGKKNILIVVFDAFSAYHLSIHGYARETTPNITRLAQRAIVYHNHFSAGNFTAPGTASLLTGTLPWTHRAIQMDKPVVSSMANKSIFHVFDDYYRIAYSHNPLAITYLDQFMGDLDDYVALEDLFLTNDGLIQKLFHKDDNTSSLSWMRTIKKDVNGGYSYSLFMSNLYERILSRRIAPFRELFPNGLPRVRGDNYFILEDAIDFLGDRLIQIPNPFLAYFHFFPPHEPYSAHRDFVDYFRNDSFQPLIKPVDLFGGGRRRTPYLLAKFRQQYDEYILYLDREFGRFYDQLSKSGLLENTWLILTSDHGELFERAIWEHTTPVLFQPVVRVPLIVFEPGRSSRLDIHLPTSAVDVLPTLLQIGGKKPVDWTEGVVLPPFAITTQNTARSLYAIEAKHNNPSLPLTNATIMLVKGRYKLTNFFGYEALEGGERTELFDIEHDPEELDNLFSIKSALAKELLSELKATLRNMDQP